MDLAFRYVTDHELQQQRDKLLASAGLTWKQLESLADNHILTEEQENLLEELDRIDFLMGK